MKVKELIRRLSTYDQERDVEIESMMYDGFMRFEIDKFDSMGMTILIIATRVLPSLTYPNPKTGRGKTRDNTCPYCGEEQFDRLLISEFLESVHCRSSDKDYDLPLV